MLIAFIIQQERIGGFANVFKEDVLTRRVSRGQRPAEKLRPLGLSQIYVNAKKKADRRYLMFLSISAIAKQRKAPDMANLTKRKKGIAFLD